MGTRVAELQWGGEGWCASRAPSVVSKVGLQYSEGKVIQDTRLGRTEQLVF
jgi:hypothetical protein